MDRFVLLEVALAQSRNEFLKNAIDIRKRLPSSSQTLLHNAEIFADMTLMLDKLTDRKTVGVLELAGIMEKLSKLGDSTSALERVAGRGADVEGKKKILTDSFESAFKSAFGKINLEDVKRVHEKYECILEAARNWDFEGCSWMAKGAGKEVQEAAKNGAAVMEAAATTGSFTFRVISGLGRCLDWSPERKEKVESFVAEFKKQQKAIDEMPPILATMCFCDALLDPSEPRKSGGTLQGDVANITAYVTTKLKVKVSSLAPRLLSEMEKAKGAAASAPSEEAAAAPVASTGPRRRKPLAARGNRGATA